MMKFKKFLAAAMTGAMMFGMVATATPAVSAIAEEAKSNYTFEVHYDTFVGEIKYTGNGDYDPYVTLEVCKDEEGQKEGTKYIYEYDGYLKVDLSFLKASKPSYIRVYGSSEERKVSPVYPVNAQPKKVTVKYVAGKDLEKEPWAAYSVNKAELKSNAEVAAYQYRTLYGSEFYDLNLLDQKTTEVAGTTIVVRKAAVTSGSAVELAPASAEAKVKIPAAPKAPKVTVDYAKGSIKLPKNAEVQVIVSGAAIEKGTGTDTTTWVDATATVMDQIAILGLFDVKDTATETPATDIAKNGFTLVVRTKAGKKAASNPAIVLIKKIDSLAEDPTENNKLTVSEGTSPATLTWKVTKTGVEYTATGAAFEYEDGGKWKAIKVGKPVLVKYSTSAEKKVNVRKAGVKAGKDTPASFPSEKKEITLGVYTAAIESVKVTAPSDKKVTAGASIPCTAEVKDVDGTAVTNGITWSVKLPGATDFTSISSGTYTIPTDATVGAEYIVKAECGGKSGEVTLKVVEATAE